MTLLLLIYILVCTSVVVSYVIRVAILNLHFSLSPVMSYMYLRSTPIFYLFPISPCHIVTVHVNRMCAACMLGHLSTTLAELGDMRGVPVCTTGPSK